MVVHHLMMKIIFKRDTSIYSIHRISLELINIGRLIPLYIRLFIYIKLAAVESSRPLE